MPLTSQDAPNQAPNQVELKISSQTSSSPSSKPSTMRNPTKSKVEKKGEIKTNQNPLKMEKKSKGESHLVLHCFELKRALKGAGVSYKGVPIITKTPLHNFSPQSKVYRYTGKCTGTNPARQQT
uniref:Uncharacterized protein n=1 Tax=Ananas comosus var. bracteatus TaxID=296719 RepID=A0A6V7PSL4_ANACO|nr:unnamed protein product [Ananas comosus var. bracteatus]